MYIDMRNMDLNGSAMHSTVLNTDDGMYHTRKGYVPVRVGNCCLGCLAR